jgi:hypothetical protein
MACTVRRRQSFPLDSAAVAAVARNPAVAGIPAVAIGRTQGAARWDSFPPEVGSPPPGSAGRRCYRSQNIPGRVGCPFPRGKSARDACSGSSAASPRRGMRARSRLRRVAA